MKAGKAELPPRAEQTLRLAVRQADERPQLHERLAELPRLFRVDLLQKRRKFILRACGIDVCFVGEQAGEDAQDVAVHRRAGHIVGDGANRPRRIVADAGERPHAREILGKAPFRDELCRFMEIAGARIVAEPFPRFEHFLLVRRGERLRRRKTLQKADVIVLDRLDARLLEHDLGDPHFVRIVRAPPGKRAFANAVPLQKERHRAL